MESSPFFISFHLFSYLPLCVQPGSLPQNLTSKSPANKWFLIKPELKIMVYVTALLQKFSDNQVCIVTCTGCDTHVQYFSTKLWQYGFQPANECSMAYHSSPG